MVTKKLPQSRRATDEELADNPQRWDAQKPLPKGWRLASRPTRHEIISSVLEYSCSLDLKKVVNRERLAELLADELALMDKGKKQKHIKKVLTSTATLSKKSFHHAVWKLADLISVEEFNNLVSPIVEDFCATKGWKFDMQQYAKEFRSLD